MQKKINKNNLKNHFRYIIGIMYALIRVYMNAGGCSLLGYLRSYLSAMILCLVRMMYVSLIIIVSA